MFVSSDSLFRLLEVWNASWASQNSLHHAHRFGRRPGCRLTNVVGAMNFEGEVWRGSQSRCRRSRPSPKPERNWNFSRCSKEQSEVLQR